MTHKILMCSSQYDAELKSGSIGQAELPAVAATLGLDGIELREPHWRDKEAEIPAARDSLTRFGLLGTYATFTTLFSRDDGIRAKLLQDVTDAAALGSPLIRLFRGELPGDGVEDTAMWDGARAALKRAEDLGVMIVLENFSGQVCNRLADVLGTVERFASPVMMVNVDVSNYVLNGQDPVEAIHALRPYVRYAHLKDVRFAPEGKVVTYLGDGELPYREILAALSECGDIPLTFEFGGGGDPERAIRSSLDYISGMISRK